MARLGVCAALLVTLLGGWLWGASGRQDLARSLRSAQVHVDLLEARAALLGARVNLCEADFAGMSRQLEAARQFVGRAGARLGMPDPGGEPGHGLLREVVAEIDEAQRLAARIGPGRQDASR